VRLIVTAAMALVAVSTNVHGQAREFNAARKEPRGAEAQTTDRIIVKWRDPQAKAASAAARTQKASAAAGVSLQKMRSLTADIDLMQAPQQLGGAALDAVIANLQADPAVEYASPNLRRHAHALPNDPMLQQQWYLLNAEISATRTSLAWETTPGNASIIVAVLDTGVRPEHPDLTGKLLSGYDFVSTTVIANDGSGRDPDPTDPGDWVSDTDLTNPSFRNCEESDSSWHGTRVSGLIGALTNEGSGIAGAAFNTRILPVRVLGKCGGFDDDIIDGMRWAAGLPVPNTPLNPNPAKIINLSLGGTGVCSSAYQDAVNDVTAQGVLVVVSAGNEGGPVSAPANCNGALGVSGIRNFGTKVGYSSIGPEIGISAPAGNCININNGDRCLFSILVPIDTGLTDPQSSGYSGDMIDANPNTPPPNFGTSFSAPLVSAAAALVQSLDTTLTPARTMLLLKESATTFPTSSSSSSTNCRVPTSVNDQQEECVCTTRTCGAGMLNTNAAVLALQNPLAAFTNTGALNVGSSVALDGSASFAPTGRTVTAYAWSVTDVVGSAPTFSTPAQATTNLQITGSGSFTVRLTITDSTGVQDSKDVPLATTVSSTPSNPPTFSNGGGGGGGGSLGWELLVLALLAGRKVTRRHGA
jgi:serine protease